MTDDLIEFSLKILIVQFVQLEIIKFVQKNITF